MSERIRKHSEIDPRHTWRFEDLYPDVAAWEAALRQAEEEVDAFRALEGKLASRPKEALDSYYRISQAVEKVFMYALLRRRCDNGDEEAQALFSRAMMLSVKAQTAASFAMPELLELPETRLAEMIQDPAFGG